MSHQASCCMSRRSAHLLALCYCVVDPESCTHLSSTWTRPACALEAVLLLQVSAKGPLTSSQAQCTASDSALAALPGLTALVNEVISARASLDCVVACLPCKGLLICQIYVVSKVSAVTLLPYAVACCCCCFLNTSAVINSVLLSISDDNCCLPLPGSITEQDRLAAC